MKRIISLAILCLFGACKSKDTGNNAAPVSYCPKQVLFPVFAGYTYAESDTVILKKYQPNSKFDVLYGETMFTNPDTVNSSGTYPLTYKNSFRNMYLNDDTDYVIHVPAADTNYYVSGIHYTLTVATYGTNRYDGCKSYLNKFVMNNDTPSTSNGQLELSNEGSWYLLYIKK